ncbi:hypothetical protein KC218_28200, partial [Mycobacterium tuberculosis]|nr:hypothetical protein [Mycobacterium tuberculosis]
MRDKAPLRTQRGTERNEATRHHNSARRPTKINTHWGCVTEPNSFGTHEFMDFAELIGAEAYVSG